jgi:hypothetical protein
MDRGSGISHTGDWFILASQTLTGSPAFLPNVAKIIAALQSGTIPETISEWAFIDRGGELAPPETRRSYSWTARLWHPTARICPSFSHAMDSTPQLCA